MELIGWLIILTAGAFVWCGLVSVFFEIAVEGFKFIWRHRK